MFVFACTSRADEEPLWLAVGRPALMEAIEPLAEHRRRDGFDVVTSTETVEKAIAAAPRRPDFLLLVGDDAEGAEEEFWHLPARSRALYRWRRAQRETFAADALWSDVDGDLVPEFSVGRIPARSADEVAAIVRKVIAFEGQPPSERDLRLLMWAGSPNYGAAIDAMATSFVLNQLETTAPRWLRPWVISADPNHALCGWPANQATTFTDQMQRGGLCHVLMGHATETHFFSMQHRGADVWYTADDAKAKLQVGDPTPPLIIFTCASGNFAGEERCLAESFLHFPGGPVATIGATTESHPLTNYYTSQAMLAALGGQANRLGSVWLTAQRKAQDARNPVMELLLKDVEGKLEDEIDVRKLRRDQMLMYAILGDPATKLRTPRPLKVEVQRSGHGWEWKVEQPAGATKLHIGIRPIEPPRLTPTKLEDEESANEALHAANELFAFQPLPAPKGWSGVIKEPGWVRFVATGPKEIYVDVVKLGE